MASGVSSACAALRHRVVNTQFVPRCQPIKQRWNGSSAPLVLSASGLCWESSVTSASGDWRERPSFKADSKPNAPRHPPNRFTSRKKLAQHELTAQVLNYQIDARGDCR